MSILRLPPKPQQALPSTAPAQTPPPQAFARRLDFPSLVPAGSIAIEDIPTRPISDEMVAHRPSPLLQIEAGVGWHTGITRQGKPNEDSVIALQGSCSDHGQLVPFGLFAVADGMGGHAYGQEASRIALQSMIQTILPNIMAGNKLNDDFLSDILLGGVEWANLAIHQRMKEWGQIMGTTLTSTLLVGTKAYLVNVGDSRIYHYRTGQGLRQITHDHSLVATLVTFGEITPEQVYTHPERNKIYRCLGYKEHIEADLFLVDLCKDDYLLLCSDGLWEMVRDPAIERLIGRSTDPKRVSDMLIQAALDSGGEDNVSAIVVRVA